MRRPVLAAGVVVLVAAAGVVAMVMRGGKSTPRTYVIRPGDLEASVHAQGRVESVHDVEVRSRVPGALTRLLVSEGQRVQAGQTIAVLDDSQQRALLDNAQQNLLAAQERLHESEALEAHRRRQSDSGVQESAARVAQCEARRASAEADARDRAAELDLARKDEERIRSLFASGAVAARDLDTVGARVASAEAKLASAQAATKAAIAEREAARASLVSAQVGPEPTDVKSARKQVEQAAATVRYQEALLHDTVIRAPFAGTVTEKVAEQGQVLREGETICLLAAMNRARVNAEVDETDIGKIGVGDPASVTHETFPGRVFMGKVARIGSLAGRHTVESEDPTRINDFRVVDVKVEGDFPATLRIGMTVDIEITHRRANVLLIPSEAVHREGAESYVEALAPNGSRERRTVRVGAQGERETEVLSGVRDGDRVVLPGSR